MLATITPTNANNEPLPTVDVLATSLDGRLAIHRSIDRDGYSLTHIPTGAAIRIGIVSYDDAETALIDLEGEDWNFKVPHSRKFKRNKARIWGYVKNIPIHTH